MITFLDDRDKAEIDGILTDYVQSAVGTLELSWIDGGSISKADGAAYEKIGSSCSDFVFVEPGDRLIISNTMTSDTEWNAFYDSDKKFLSSFETNNRSVIIVPSGARYFRLSKHNQDTVVIIRGLQKYTISTDKEGFICLSYNT